MSNFMNAANKHRRAHWLATYNLRLLAKVYDMWIYLIHNSLIPAECEVGESTTFGYKGIGVVVHKRAKIGKNCAIAQNVTIGGRSGHYEVPVIGNNFTIGANSMMMKDAPDGTVWGVQRKCSGTKTATGWSNVAFQPGRCVA